MRRIDFELPIFDWDITIVTLYDKNDKESLVNLLNEIEADEQGKKSALHWLEIGAKNGGDTWRDYDNKHITIVIYPWSDKEQFFKSLNHEKRHAIDRMCEYCNITDIETPAYIDGYLSHIIFSRLKELT